MKDKFSKPIITISKCLTFSPCRYDAQIINNDFIERLKPFVNFQVVCPEFEIGLGIPRAPLRVIYFDNHKHLFQPNSDRFFTKEIEDYTQKMLPLFKDSDGFILKESSPSCGLGSAKYYTKNRVGVYAPCGKTDGFFAEKVKEFYPYLPIESEARLSNFKIRERFLISVFILAKFKEIKKRKIIKELIEFQAENKFLFLAINESIMRRLGKVVASNLDNVFEVYQDLLFILVKSQWRISTTINSIVHIYGFFKDILTSSEKEYFFQLLDNFKKRKAPLSVLSALLYSYAVRSGNEYILKQTFFNPYPFDLLDITDSGKGRDY